MRKGRLALMLPVAMSLVLEARAAEPPIVPLFVDETQSSGLDSVFTGEWEFKLGEVERGQRERSAFMQEIVEQIQKLIDTGLSPPATTHGLGSCPRCQAAVVEGRGAYGCARWRDNCGFRLPKVYRGLRLSHQRVRELCTRGVVLRPVSIEGSPRVLCLTATGEAFDLEPPSRGAQRRRAHPTEQSSEQSRTRRSSPD